MPLVDISQVMPMQYNLTWDFYCNTESCDRYCLCDIEAGRLLLINCMHNGNAVPGPSLHGRVCVCMVEKCQLFTYFQET